jgi:hypothetical protein
MNRKLTAQQLGWLFTALALAAVGCGQGGGPVPTQPARPPGDAAGPAREEPARIPSAGSRTPEEETLGEHQFPHKGGTVNRPLTAARPRQACYTGLRFTVTKGTISDGPPPTKQRRADADQVYAYLDVSLQNRTDSTTYVNIPPGLFKLRLGEDEFGSPLTDDWLLDLRPRATERVTLAFAVPRDTTWERAALVISQEKEEPETLALTGPAPAPRSPVAMTLPAQRELKTRDFACQLTAVALDVEHGRKRAPKGQWYLKLTGTLVTERVDGFAAFFGDRQLRIVAAGSPAEAVAAPSENLAPNTPKAFEAVYLIPAGTRAVEFRVGDQDATAAQVLLELKAAQP